MTRFLLTTLCLLALAAPARPQAVTFPSAEVEFVAGPQVRQSGIPWYDQTAFEKGLQHGEAFPAVPPGLSPFAGTLAVTQGSTSVVGSGTRFLTDLPGPLAEYNFFVADASGVRRVYYVESVQSDTRLTLKAAYRETSGSGRTYSAATAADVSAYQLKLYYDLAKVEYVNYYRTGDERFRTYARKVADSWWLSPAHVNSGHGGLENSIAPRDASLEGMMLRAMDGRPEFWPWITAYAREHYETWVGKPLGWFGPLTDAQIKGEAPREEGGQQVTKPVGFYFGIREGAYALLFAADLARVHPDPAVREEFRRKALDGAAGYYARIQGLQPPADGGFYFYLDDLEGLTTQPFQEGILGEPLIAVHRLTNDPAVRTSIIRLAEHLYVRTYNPAGWRAPYYFVGGKLIVRDAERRDTGQRIDCAAGCGAASNPFPPPDVNQIAEARQLAGTMIHVFGYAYLLTGDAKFKTWGDEILDSVFSGADGHRALCGATNHGAKEYDECMRSSGKYLAWRLGAASPTPTPTPIPSPTPVATPTPAPTPTPTPPPPSPTPTPPLPPAVENVSAITIGGGGGWKRAGQSYVLPIRCYDLFSKQVSCPPGMEIINTNAQVGTFDVFGNFRALVPGRTFLAVRYGTFLGQSLQIRVQ